jgi:glycosyltransferase involved in cell wall biosynthesis
MAILKHRRADSIIANGLFIELSIARIFSNFSYIAKVPGDIVWERARNKGVTSADIESYQREVLPAGLRLMRFLYTRSLRMASAIVVPSEQLKRLIEGWGIESHKIRVIHNSVDTELFHPVSNLNKDIDVLTVCRLVPWKGVYELIECSVKYGFNLTIVGDGPERKKLEDLANKLEGNVNFLGDLDQHSLPQIYARSKYFVLNSSFEATSYAMLEARSSGLVCVGNSSTGSSEIIDHRVDGFICRGSDQFSLSDFFECVRDIDFDYLAFSSLSILDTKRRFDLKTNYKAIYKLAEEQN